MDRKRERGEYSIRPMWRKGYRKAKSGRHLAVQWLDLAFSAEGAGSISGSIPGQGAESPLASPKNQNAKTVQEQYC